MVVNHAWGDDCRFAEDVFLNWYWLSWVVLLVYVCSSWSGWDKQHKGLGFRAQTTTCSSDTPRQFPLRGDPPFALTTLDGWQSALGKLRVEGFGDLILGDWMKCCWNVDQFCLIFPLDLVNHYGNHLTQVFVYPTSVFEKFHTVPREVGKKHASNGPKNRDSPPASCSLQAFKHT